MKQPTKDRIRPLASIPNKEGFQLLGVRKDGSQARLTVFVDESGFYRVLRYTELVGWRMP